MLPVHANVAPILPSPLSDVSQVAVNRPQATREWGFRNPENQESWALESRIRDSLIPLHGAIQWKNQANQTV